MKVSDLISVLKKAPQDSEIFFHSDAEGSVAFDRIEISNDVYFMDYDEEGNVKKKPDIEVTKQSSKIYFI